MASTKTRHSMVFLKDGTTVPTASAADPPPARLAALRPEKVNRSGTVQSTRVFGDEAGLEHNMYAVKEAFTRTGENRPAGLNTDSVSPDSVCKGVRVTLDNNSMWNECFRCRTEMILTKQGSRMFPYCRFRISGLQQCRKYVLVMDIQPLDSSQYRWTGDSWQVSRKAECQIKTKPFIHPESPATGQHWMQGPVSFYKLKLTNNTSDQEGNIILHPLHRYLPRLHLVETDKAVKDIRLNGPNVLTFAFPQTEFMTVTTYQNPQFAQLKVNYNPFAKGLKEDGSNLSGLKLKTNSGRELNKDGGNAVAEQHPVKKSLKFLLANHKPRFQLLFTDRYSSGYENIKLLRHVSTTEGKRNKVSFKPSDHSTFLQRTFVLSTWTAAGFSPARRFWIFVLGPLVFQQGPVHGRIESRWFLGCSRTSEPVSLHRRATL
uniref:T-box domain-containing protein n=1 Tax=Kryptolebias marmoratus TaxID=37003 RepID=A0A3Q3F9G1_KRYMA